MYAIIETSGAQFKVEEGMKFDTNRMDAKEGDSIEINEVLLINENGDTKVGTPYVEGAKVKVKVVEHKRGDKIIVFKMKAKKRYQKKQGHRQELTTLEVTEIKG